MAGITQRYLGFQFLTTTGSFTGGPVPNNLLQLGGLRATVKVAQPGKNYAGEAQIAIYGMELGHMDTLSLLGQYIQRINKNSITIVASDSSGAAGSIVFSGIIVSAYIDLQSSAQVPFRIGALTNAADAIATIPVTSAKGTQDAIPLIKALATAMGLAFENNSGLAIPIADQYYWGAPLFQVTQACKAANLDWVIEKGILAVWPANQTRITGPVTLLPGIIVVNPVTGLPGSVGGHPVQPSSGITLTPRDGSLLGYPFYTASGIKVRTLFNPSIKFGTAITIADSILGGANGPGWVIYSIIYDLDTRLPNGKWEMSLECFNPAFNKVQPLPATL